MDRERARSRLSGCYVTVPTMFRDDDLEVDLEATRQHVRFLIDGGVNESNAVILAVGAAGDFPTMSVEERLGVAEAIIQEANGRIPVVMGVQTTNTRELVELIRSAKTLGAEYVQVSPPYYYMHTAEDFLEYAIAAAEAADIGVVVYNTFWTSHNVSLNVVERLCELPNVVGLKWAVPTALFMESEQVVSRFAERLCIIDNQLRFVTSTSWVRGASKYTPAITGRSGACGCGSCSRTGATSRRRKNLCMWRCPSTHCGRRCFSTPAAMGTSTSCAWNWSVCPPAGAARPRGTCGMNFVKGRARCSSRVEYRELSAARLRRRPRGKLPEYHQLTAT